MHNGQYIVLKRQLWRFAGYDIICSSAVLCAYHIKHIYFTEKAARYRAAIQSFRLSDAARYLYYSGINLLHISHKDEAPVCRYQPWNCFNWRSFILSCGANKKKCYAGKV